MSTYNNNLHPENNQPTTPVTDDKPEGFTFNWIPLAVAALFLLSGYVKNWAFLFFLAIVVIIHELGHVVMGKHFGCAIKEMQVFFFAFLSYKPRKTGNGGWWRNITWSLGVLPWGGVTVFESRPEADDAETSGTTLPLDSAMSPYINDKPAWQRLPVSAGGVLFNLATFAILYLAMLFLPEATWGAVCYPLASLSLVLAVLNILPVYPLDGGAILFAGYEIATGRKPSTKFVNTCGIIGFALIIIFFWIFPGFVNRLIDSVMGVFF